ncbi:hypothetical protein [Leifsonia shinshuensis]|uniref:HEAT repeat domain-containing protein n=1 Tax=Leifsonia shinshuensis TaxID=150026 RepID=A0A7G6Y9W0_9MICO|nr:hypothetical protein [Leifsonia shinshuensis]QNE35275.1 hypothetical protein F1C12_09120 [Leifsonia shinshuensis]
MAILPDLAALWSAALSGDPAPVELALAEDSRLPGPRANLELAARFADTVAADRATDLAVLAGWLVTPPRLAASLPEGTEEFLPACAALAAGAVAARAAADGGRLPGDAVGLLTTAAGDARWRVRELAATGMQRVLAADWATGLRQVRGWLDSAEPLPMRAAVAAVAEPPLLRDPQHAADAVAVVREAVEALLDLPAARRRDDDVRVLRKALGYAISVVAAADPEDGLPLLERLAASTDPDAAWLVRENLTKARLKPYAERLAALRAPKD